MRRWFLKKLHLFGWMVLLTIVLTACQSSDSVQFTDVWARPGWKEGNSAVFFMVQNGADQDDKLLAAASDIANAVELHESSMVDGVMKMEKQEFVPLPVGEEVLFKPGGLHIMLIGLKDDLIVLDKFSVILTFENAGEVTLDVVVKEP